MPHKTHELGPAAAHRGVMNSTPSNPELAAAAGGRSTPHERPLALARWLLIVAALVVAIVTLRRVKFQV